MSELPPLDEDWAPVDELDERERFKWGWNSETGAADLWPVRGPGDGLPTHKEHLAQAWGREPSLARGDVLGLAVVEEAAGLNEPKQILVQAYFGTDVPASVLAAFAAAFPEVAITAVSSTSGAEAAGGAPSR